MPGYELTFKLPFTELCPYYKDKIRYFRKLEFCVIDFDALCDPQLTDAKQLEAFRCAIREHCNETGREIIVDSDSMPDGSIIIELAPKGHKGSVPEMWTLEDDIAAAIGNPRDKKERGPKLILPN